MFEPFNDFSTSLVLNANIQYVYIKCELSLLIFSLLRLHLSRYKTKCLQSSLSVFQLNQ